MSETKLEELTQKQEETLIRECEDCGNDFELDHENDTETLCEDCREHYYVCAECGDRVHEDRVLYSSTEDDSYCADCYDSLFTSCEHCDNEVSRRESYRVDGDYYCERCYYNCFTTCDNCGSVIHVDDSYYSERRDATYCEDCYNRRGDDSNYLHGYHDFNDRIRFYNHIDDNTSHNSDYLYLGVELETDGYDERGDAADELYQHSNHESLFHMERDSSLDNGIEIVTMPCTLDYHRNQFPWREITETVKEYGGKSHDTSTCGLHIHFNRSFIADSPDLTTLKLLHVFEKLWDNLVIFSRRDAYSLKEYAKRYNDNFIPCSNPADKLWDTRRKGRYFAVNLRNENTIEIRMFKGTLKVSTILASIEFVDFLVRYCKIAGIRKMQELTWDKLTSKIDSKKYPNLVNYLAEKDLIENKQLTLAENNQEEN